MSFRIVKPSPMLKRLYEADADVEDGNWDVRFTPESIHKSDIAACPLSAKSGHRAVSFDHLVGASQQRERDAKAQCFRCLEIDDQLQTCDPLHRQVGRPFALENPAGINTGLLPSNEIVRSIAPLYPRKRTSPP